MQSCNTGARFICRNNCWACRRAARVRSIFLSNMQWCSVSVPPSPFALLQSLTRPRPTKPRNLPAAVQITVGGRVCFAFKTYCIDRADAVTASWSRAIVAEEGQVDGSHFRVALESRWKLSRRSLYRAFVTIDRTNDAHLLRCSKKWLTPTGHVSSSVQDSR